MAFLPCHKMLVPNLTALFASVRKFAQLPLSGPLPGALGVATGRASGKLVGDSIDVNL
jgi:hypothetical protein